MRSIYLVLGCLLNSLPLSILAANANYSIYHAEIYQAEELIADQNYAEALDIYRSLFDRYDFVFVRDYKVATQMAWQLGHKEEAFQYLRSGITGGWEMKSIKKNKFLKAMRREQQWSTLKGEYDSLHEVYQQRLNREMRAEIRQMSLRDQRKALGALFRIGSKSQDRFGENKFAPVNEKHMIRLMEMIEDEEFPGERLVGFEAWGQGIISRHNSISRAYCQEDTVFAYLRPILSNSVHTGNLTPASFAWIEEWFFSVESGWSKSSYGYLKTLKTSEIPVANALRKEIGLRAVETRNRLIDLQRETGMDLYLPHQPKKNGKIIAEPAT